MALTLPPALTPAPSPAPDRGDRSTFSARVELLLTWLSTAGTQLGALGDNVYDNATVAELAATNAESTANITKWVSGTAYLEGDVVWSPTNFRAYRAKMNNSDPNDPVIGTTVWASLYTDTTSTKDVSNGYPGLTLFKINFTNAAGTFMSFFTNSNTAARTYTFPDKDGTVAMLDDVTSGSLSTSPTIGIGYATGAGASVTQATSKGTAVTINTVTGRITTSNATLAAGARAFFFVNNTSMTSANDVVVINGFSSGGGAHMVWVDTRDVGSFRIGIWNFDTASHSLALTIDYTIIRAVAA